MPIDVHRILSELDTEISRLQQIRTALTGSDSPVAGSNGAKKRGRPPGSKNAGSAKPATGKRQLSPEARKRIADAQKKRWAEKKKAE